MIRLSRANIPIDSQFKLYITTELPSPEFPSEVSVYSNLINFTISRQALEAQLLSIIAVHKLEAVEREFVDLKKKAFDCITRLD